MASSTGSSSSKRDYSQNTLLQESDSTTSGVAHPDCVHDQRECTGETPEQSTEDILANFSMTLERDPENAFQHLPDQLHPEVKSACIKFVEEGRAKMDEEEIELGRMFKDMRKRCKDCSSPTTKCDMEDILSRFEKDPKSALQTLTDQEVSAIGKEERKEVRQKCVEWIERERSKMDEKEQALGKLFKGWRKEGKRKGKRKREDIPWEEKFRGDMRRTYPKRNRRPPEKITYSVRGGSSKYPENATTWLLQGNFDQLPSY
jgi:hypothetical protein